MRMLSSLVNIHPQTTGTGNSVAVSYVVVCGIHGQCGLARFVNEDGKACHEKTVTEKSPGSTLVGWLYQHVHVIRPPRLAISSHRCHPIILSTFAVDFDAAAVQNHLQTMTLTSNVLRRVQVCAVLTSTCTLKFNDIISMCRVLFLFRTWNHLLHVSTTTLILHRRKAIFGEGKHTYRFYDRLANKE